METVEKIEHPKCCGVQMELMGLESRDGELIECLRCNTCNQGVNLKQNKFEDGKLRADGLNGRYDQNTFPVDRHAPVRPSRADREEAKILNTYSLMISTCGMGKRVMKTRDQRRLELQAILEREVEL